MRQAPWGSQCASVQREAELRHIAVHHAGRSGIVSEDKQESWCHSRRGPPRKIVCSPLYPARIVNVCWHAARRSSCALPMCDRQRRAARQVRGGPSRSEEHTSELQSQSNLVCRLLLEKKK